MYYLAKGFGTEYIECTSMKNSTSKIIERGLNTSYNSKNKKTVRSIQILPNKANGENVYIHYYNILSGKSCYKRYIKTVPKSSPENCNLDVFISHIEFL